MTSDSQAVFAAAREVDFTEIPVIDAGALMTPDGMEDVAKAIHQAATRVGFFYLANHGIEAHVTDRAFAVARAFFDLPEEAKQTIAIDTDQRGWMASGMSTMEGAATWDLKEVFFWGLELAPDHPDVLAGKPLMAVNKWPDAVFPELKRDLLPYYDAVCGVARHVLRAIAVGFGAPRNFFDKRYDTPLARGQLVYYPTSERTHEAEQRFGVAPHSDFGVLTFLLQDDSGGLQIRNRAGEWIAAPPVPDTLVCNIGDLLQRWTNDRFVSTEHRVINRSGRKRYSIPVFFDPGTDAVIDPRDLNLPTGEAPRHEPVRTGDHIAGRNRKAFAQYRS